MSSESIVENLCREACSLRERAINIVISINNSKNSQLISRLKSELFILEQRRKELRNTGKFLESILSQENLSVQLLIEISSRSTNHLYGFNAI